MQLLSGTDLSRPQRCCFGQSRSDTAQNRFQELAATLLDGLHEDLNRVQKKVVRLFVLGLDHSPATADLPARVSGRPACPEGGRGFATTPANMTLLDTLVQYIEEPDTDGVPLAIAGDTAWANHKRRNDSVIVDMFQVPCGSLLYAGSPRTAKAQPTLIRSGLSVLLALGMLCLHLSQGQYKSAIRCRACGYESVTFEPFMFLSLPITNNRHTSLEACLRKFAKVETLSKNDQWCGSGPRLVDDSSMVEHACTAAMFGFYRSPPLVGTVLLGGASAAIVFAKRQSPCGFGACHPFSSSI